jgi:hypothetical protein
MRLAGWVGSPLQHVSEVAVRIVAAPCANIR